MRILLLALPVALLTFGSIELSSQSEQTKPAVSRVHQLQIEDQSENPGNISQRTITVTAMHAVRRFASCSKTERLPRVRITPTLH